MKKKKYEDMTVGEGIIEGLKQAVDYEKGKKAKGVRVRKYAVEPLPKYKGQDVKKIRQKLGLSQSMFAKVLGVSIKTVEAWEAGTNQPMGPAQRLLSFMKSDDQFLNTFNLIKNS